MAGNTLDPQGIYNYLREQGQSEEEIQQLGLGRISDEAIAEYDEHESVWGRTKAFASGGFDSLTLGGGNKLLTSLGFVDHDTFEAMNYYNPNWVTAGRITTDLATILGPGALSIGGKLIRGGKYLKGAQKAGEALKYTPTGFITSKIGKAADKASDFIGKAPIPGSKVAGKVISGFGEAYTDYTAFELRDQIADEAVKNRDFNVQRVAQKWWSNVKDNGPLAGLFGSTLGGLGYLAGGVTRHLGKKVTKGKSSYLDNFLKKDFGPDVPVQRVTKDIDRGWESGAIKKKEDIGPYLHKLYSDSKTNYDNIITKSNGVLGNRNKVANLITGAFDGKVPADVKKTLRDFVQKGADDISVKKSLIIEEKRLKRQVSDLNTQLGVAKANKEAADAVEIIEANILFKQSELTEIQNAISNSKINTTEAGLKAVTIKELNEWSNKSFGKIKDDTIRNKITDKIDDLMKGHFDGPAGERQMLNGINARAFYYDNLKADGDLLKWFKKYKADEENSLDIFKTLFKEFSRIPFRYGGLGGLGGLLGGGGLTGAAAGAGVAYAGRKGYNFLQKKLMMGKLDKGLKLYHRVLDDSIDAFVVGNKRLSYDVTRITLDSFGDGSDEDNYKLAAERISDNLTNIDQFADQVDMATAGMDQIFPDVSERMSEHAMVTLLFLQSKLIKQPASGDILGNNQLVLNNQELTKFNRYLSAVMNPQSVVEDFGNGQLTMEGIEVLQMLFPDIRQDLLNGVLDKLSDKNFELSMDQKIQLSMLMGTRFETSLEPQNINNFQNRYRMLREKEAEQKGNLSQDQLNRDTAEQTTTQRLESK